uniref:Uncharacterized protein n=1 Tax=Anopheles farauti TaxID=69004 RepID=A0A182QW60_9DIPT
MVDMVLRDMHWSMSRSMHRDMDRGVHRMALPGSGLVLLPDLGVAGGTLAVVVTGGVRSSVVTDVAVRVLLVVLHRFRMVGMAELLHDRVETVVIIGGILDDASRTIGFLQHVSAWKMRQIIRLIKIRPNVFRIVLAVLVVVVQVGTVLAAVQAAVIVALAVARGRRLVMVLVRLTDVLVVAQHQRRLVMVIFEQLDRVVDGLELRFRCVMHMLEHVLVLRNVVMLRHECILSRFNRSRLDSRRGQDGNGRNKLLEQK